MKPVILDEEEVAWVSGLIVRAYKAERKLMEKEVIIKNLEERVKKYMAKYPNGANGCTCLFDDDEKLITLCPFHKERESAERARCLKAVDDEPEGCPITMVCYVIDRTKKNIRKRIEG